MLSSVPPSVLVPPGQGRGDGKVLLATIMGQHGNELVVLLNAFNLTHINGRDIRTRRRVR
jgi:hypothetical protein